MSLEHIRSAIYKYKLIRWFYFVLAVLLVCTLLSPIYWMLKISLSEEHAVFDMPPKLWPNPLSFKGYASFWDRANFLRFYLNSILVSCGTVAVCLFAGMLAAYSFSRFEYRGRNPLMLFTLSAQMFPWALLLISLYIFFIKAHLFNSYIGLIVAHSTFALPLTIWIIKGYFDTVPKEMEEAAIVDGCSQLQVLVRIMIPVCYPGILAAGIYVFIFSWNDFLFNLTLTSRDEMRTLGPGIALTFMAEHSYAWVDMMAATIMVSLPVIVVFLLLQNFFVKGLTSGAVK